MVNSIINKLKELGFYTIPESFYSKVDEWDGWYRGNVESFHPYKVYTGINTVTCRRYSLGAAEKVCKDWANLLLNEKVKITLEGRAEQEFVDEVFRDNNFWVKANELQELTAALGTTAIVARVTGQQASAVSGVSAGSGRVCLDYVTIHNIMPLSWQNGQISECAFGSALSSDGKDYYYLQIHKLVNGLYDISNYLYKSNSDSYIEVPLSTVKELAKVPAVVHTGSEHRQFVIDRLNIVNNVDYTLPVGVAVFANAIDVLKGIDIVYDSYINEFVLGKKRIMVKPGATKTDDGEPVFDPSDVVYYVLPEDSNDVPLIQPIDMDLRVNEHKTGLQDSLNLLSAKCGFGENHYQFDNGNITTATQVVSENSEMFRTIKKHEIVLNDVLIELCRIILRLGNTALGKGLNEDVEISIDFDDSIIEDKQSDFNHDMQLLTAGIMNDWEFRMKWMNEDEATARAALPKMEDMTDEPQNEVE